MLRLQIRSCSEAGASAYEVFEGHSFICNSTLWDSEAVSEYLAPRVWDRPTEHGLCSWHVTCSSPLVSPTPHHLDSAMSDFPGSNIRMPEECWKLCENENTVVFSEMEVVRIAFAALRLWFPQTKSPEESSAGYCSLKGCNQQNLNITAGSQMQLNSQFRSVAQLCPTLCDPMNRSTPGFPVHHQLPEFTQTHILWVGDAIQPSHPLSSPSPLTFNLSQHQGLFQWVSSSH